MLRRRKQETRLSLVETEEGLHRFSLDSGTSSNKRRFRRVSFKNRRSAFDERLEGSVLPRYLFRRSKILASVRQRPTRGHKSALPVSLGHLPIRVMTQKTLEEKQRCTGPFGNSLAPCPPHGPEDEDTRSALHVGFSVRTDASRRQRLSLAESTCKIRINDSRRAVQTLHNLSKLRFSLPRRWPYLLSTEPLFFYRHIFSLDGSFH